MSTSTWEGRPGAEEDLRGRGRTTISDRVVEKIAAQAVQEVQSAAGTPRALLGVRVGGPRPQPQVEASVYGDVVRLRVSMSVRWPESVRSVTAAVRERVAERVGALTGLRVAAVDIDIPVLLTATGPDGGVR